MKPAARDFAGFAVIQKLSINQKPSFESSDAYGGLIFDILKCFVTFCAIRLAFVLVRFQLECGSFVHCVLPESESRGLMFRYFRGAEFKVRISRFSFRKMHQNPASRIGEEWLRTSRAYGYVRSALRGEEPSFVVLDFESQAARQLPAVVAVLGGFQVFVDGTHAWSQRLA